VYLFNEWGKMGILQKGKPLIVLLLALLVAAACSMRATNQADQKIVIVSIRTKMYESAADRLAKIEVVRPFYSGGHLVWFMLTPDSFEKLCATGVEFERWHRIVVSLSKEAYEPVADIKNVHVDKYDADVWLELTPSNVEKLWASGVKFEIRKAAILRFGEYHFDPLVGEPSLPVELTANYRPWSPALYLVQFFGRSKDEWFADLEKNGVEVLQYVQSNTYRARMTPWQAARIEKLEFVRWVGPYHPAYRVSPCLWEYVGTVESGMIENVSTMIYDDGQAGGTVDSAIREIEALGGKLIDQSRSGPDPLAYVTFVLPASAITPTAALNDLLWLEYGLSEVILE
jgi:hypothetical protein